MSQNSPRTVAEILLEADTLIKKSDMSGAIHLLTPLTAHPLQAHLPVLLKLSEVYMRAGRASEALPLLDAAHRRDPSDAECAFLFGRALIDSHLFDRALPLLKQALAASPNSYKVNWALADYYNLCERADLAIPHFEVALRDMSDPVQIAALTVILGVAYKSVNRPQDARRCFDSVKSPETIRISAQVQAFSLTKQSPESEEGLALSRLASTTRNPYHRSDILLELAKSSDAAKEFDKAFEFAAAARATFKITQHDGAKLLEKDAAKRRIFTKDLYRKSVPLTSQDEHIILIAGMPRSGTTLMEQVLGAHSAVGSFGETTRFTRLSEAFQHNVTQLPDPAAAILASGQRGELLARAKDNLGFLRSISDKPWERAVEKTPMNFEAMGYMHLIHPKARFIHCRRHPADSFISSYQNALNQYHDYAYSQETYAERYIAKERLMQYWKSVFPEQIFEIEYEALVASPEEHVKAILDFAGLPWEDGVMKFFERQTTVRTFSTQQVRSSFYQSSKGRWTNYRKHLDPLFNKLESEGLSYP